MTKDSKERIFFPCVSPLLQICPLEKHSQCTAELVR